MTALSCRLEPGCGAAPPSAEASLFSIAISLKRIADALTPQDGAASCELVQQISEMLADRPAAGRPWNDALLRHRFGELRQVERVAN